MKNTIGNLVPLTLHAWLNGWRRDYGNWWVRARRANDPLLNDRPELGFTEEACIAVRTRKIARQIDQGQIS